MTHDDVCFLSATAALTLFEARKLSPVELLRAMIQRAERVNPLINCFADCYFDEALARAKVSEARYMSRAATLPLDGIPLAVKDAQHVGGKRTTHGSLIPSPIDERSDPMIERLLTAGAIVFARTTTPEFCLSNVTHSRAWGITRNPWNPAFTSGGSSGGSGAALAAGLTTLATGTDIGGSIRNPASACGIVGYKPPHGRNPDAPPANYDRFNHCGPMTRSVADAALMQNVTSGPHPLDHDSLRTRVMLPLQAGGLDGFRIAWSLDLGYVDVDPEVRRNTLQALEVFRALGARTTEVELGWTPEVNTDASLWYTMMEFGRQVVWLARTHADVMCDYTLKFAEAASRQADRDDVHRPWARAHCMYQTLGPVLAQNDVFLCPTTNLPAVKADHDPWDPHFVMNGKPADADYGWVMTHQFNMLHNCPVMSVPSGHAGSGVATGLQIVGRTWDDPSVFQAALAYEAAVGGWYGSAATRPTLDGV